MIDGESIDTWDSSLYDEGYGPPHPHQHRHARWHGEPPEILLVIETLAAQQQVLHNAAANENRHPEWFTPFHGGRGRRRSWSDEQLIDACAHSHNWVQVTDRLGMARSSGPQLKRRANELGLVLTPKPVRRRTPKRSGRKRTWTDRQLIEACAVSRHWLDVTDRLGLSYSHQGPRRRAKELGVRPAGLLALRDPSLPPGFEWEATHPPSGEPQ